MIEILFTQTGAGSMAAAKEAHAGGLGGDASDVFCFPLSLDIGQIGEDILGAQRIDALKRLHAVFPQGDEAAKELVAAAAKDMERFRARGIGTEPIRVWFSSEPDEMCGWLWFASVLQEMTAHGPVTVVNMPAWEERNDGTVVMHTGFGEVSPEDWSSYARFARQAPPLLIAGRQFDWTLLRQQNAGLRAVISGRVVSVPVSFYDFLIESAVSSAPDAFYEAMIIGNVLGRSQIGISDAWVALRIDEMIAQGRLDVVMEAEDPDGPAYNRILRKRAQ